MIEIYITDNHDDRFGNLRPLAGTNVFCGSEFWVVTYVCDEFFFIKILSVLRGTDIISETYKGKLSIRIFLCQKNRNKYTI
jgi:hypothetical protein